MDTLIIGGGAAGLAAACFATGKTVVLERLASPGRKLLATGGGRCNLTHDTDADGIAVAFGNKSRFLLPALHAFPPRHIRTFFRTHGIETCVDEDGCVFPVSQKAADVLDVLQRMAYANSVEMCCGVRAESLVLDPDSQRIIAVETSKGTFTPRRVILAAGGQSYPELGSDGSGFTLARQVGLDVIRPVPALAGLIIADEWVSTLSGILCEHGSVRLEDGKPIVGPVLFTHKGISGPPALALSGEINARQLATIRVSFRAERTIQDWIALFGAWRQKCGKRMMHNLLSGELPRALAVTLCNEAGVSDTTAAQMCKMATQTLAGLCGNCVLKVMGTEGWRRAMLTRGGVALQELDSKTLASKRIPNLYCVGEVVDLDAPCGGFNLSWAFASGRLAVYSSTKG